MAQHDTYVAAGAQNDVAKEIDMQRDRVRGQIHNVRAKAPELTSQGLMGDGGILKDALEKIGQRGDMIIHEFQIIQDTLKKAANLSAESIERMKQTSKEVAMTLEDFGHITNTRT